MSKAIGFHNARETRKIKKFNKINKKEKGLILYYKLKY